jgi:hypothetical protein
MLKSLISPKNVFILMGNNARVQKGAMIAKLRKIHQPHKIINNMKVSDYVVPSAFIDVSNVISKAYSSPELVFLDYVSQYHMDKNFHIYCLMMKNVSDYYDPEYIDDIRAIQPIRVVEYAESMCRANTSDGKAFETIPACVLLTRLMHIGL